MDVKIPTVGESISEVTLAKWLVKNGQLVKRDTALAEIESDKATLELPAEVEGVITFLVEEGSTVPIGMVVAKIEAGGTATVAVDAAKDAPPKAEPVKTEPASTVKGHPSPAAAKIMQERQITPESVSGTGPGGRILKQDVIPFPVEPAQPQKQAMNTEKIRREKMSNLRKTIAKRLVEAKNTTAMLTTFNEVDMGAAMSLRKKYKEAFQEKKGIGLGFMSLFTRAAVLALREFPAANAQIDGTDLVFHDYVNMGIAVSTPKGLVVPVVRNAETLSLAAIEQAIKDLAVKGREGKLSMEEMTGGTFTITNGGVFGSMLSTPILNIPQSAILGLHNIVDRPVVKNGQIVIAPVMYVALSYDHRIIDGRESVGLLKTIKELMEDPARMLLEI